MDLKGRLIEFVQRTGQNLEITESWRSLHPEDGFHEVTHLINSLHGLVVVPSEKIFDRVADHMDPVTVEPIGIPAWDVTFLIDGAAPPGDLPGFVTGLRNAVAHYDLDYGIDETRNITDIVFQVKPWGRRGNPPPPPWDATFKIDELHAFLRQLTHSIEKAYEKTPHQELVDDG
jgi:HEPN pEK499 p136